MKAGLHQMTASESRAALQKSNSGNARLGIALNVCSNSCNRSGRCCWDYFVFNAPLSDVVDFNVYLDSNAILHG